MIRLDVLNIFRCIGVSRAFCLPRQPHTRGTVSADAERDSPTYCISNVGYPNGIVFLFFRLSLSYRPRFLVDTWCKVTVSICARREPFYCVPSCGCNRAVFYAGPGRVAPVVIRRMASTGFMVVSCVARVLQPTRKGPSVTIEEASALCGRS